MKKTQPYRRLVIIVVFCVLVLGFGMAAMAQTADDIATEVKMKPQKEAIEFLRDTIDVFFDRGGSMGFPENLLKAAETNPSSPELAYGVAYFYSRAGKPAECINILNDIEQINPDMLYLIRTKAYCYMLMGAHRKALEFYQQALEKEGSQYDQKTRWRIHMNLGMIYAALGEQERSNEEYARAQFLNPEVSAPYHNMANNYLDSQDWDKAIELMQEALKRGQHPFFYKSLGVAYSGKKQYEEAIEQFKKAVALDPFFYDGWVSLGIAYMDIGHYAEAEKTFEDVLISDPRNIFASSNLGALYERQRKYDKAIEMYKQSLEIDPDDSFALKRLKLVEDKKAAVAGGWCYKFGQEISGVPAPGNDCCENEGLLRVGRRQNYNETCQLYDPSQQGEICLRCGDGTCDEDFESFCNCPADCKLPQNKVTEKSSGWWSGKTE